MRVRNCNWIKTYSIKIAASAAYTCNSGWTFFGSFSSFDPIFFGQNMILPKVNTFSTLWNKFNWRMFRGSRFTYGNGGRMLTMLRNGCTAGRIWWVCQPMHRGRMTLGLGGLWCLRWQRRWCLWLRWRWWPLRQTPSSGQTSRGEVEQAQMDKTDSA